MIGGFKTNIEIKVGVNTDGWAYSCDKGANPSYNGLLIDKGFMKKAEPADDKIIDRKIKSLYRSDDITWEQTDSCFAKLKDESLCVIYDITVTPKGKSPETVKLLRFVEN